MLRLGLDASLEAITSGPTDSDAVFDVIEWAERSDQVSALIGAAVEHNGQNTALQKLQRDAASWFAPPSAALGNTAAPPAAPPVCHAGGDVIIATIGADTKNVAVGKNVTQFTGDPQPRPPE